MECRWQDACWLCHLAFEQLELGACGSVGPVGKNAAMECSRYRSPKLSTEKVVPNTQRVQITHYDGGLGRKGHNNYGLGELIPAQ